MSTHHPTSDRPEMPDGYGVPADSTDLFNWADVERRLVRHAVTLTRAARRAQGETLEQGIAIHPGRLSPVPQQQSRQTRTRQRP